MTEGILVVNSGSSSIKFSFFAVQPEGLELELRGQIEGLFTSPRMTVKDKSGATIHDQSWPADSKLGHEGGIDEIVEYLRRELTDFHILGIGHRVVHGGLNYTHPVRVDAEVLAELERLIPIVPLHQPPNLAPIRRALERRPDIPQVACFDTSFHRTIPYVAQLYGLPLEAAEAGALRWGFHGLSYEYIASVLPQHDERAASGKTVVLHLGNGSSMCAMEGCRSMATTMGFSGVEGLPMGTRSGALDPGILLFLMEVRKMDVHAIEDLIYKRSGLLGISGISSDMRALLASEEPRAKLAIDLFVYRIGRELGSLAAALCGLGALVFTGGIGEHAAPIRERVCRDAAWLGVRLDAKANARGGPRISTARSRVQAWVIPTNEELIIASHALHLLQEEPVATPLNPR
jgi:acetate kinase